MLRRTSGKMFRPTLILRESEGWRDHGISYLKYLNVCTVALHKCVKDSKKGKYVKHSEVSYFAQKFDDGAQIFAPYEVPGVPASPAKYGLGASGTKE